MIHLLPSCLWAGAVLVSLLALGGAGPWDRSGASGWRFGSGVSENDVRRAPVAPQPALTISRSLR